MKPSNSPLRAATRLSTALRALGDWPDPGQVVALLTTLEAASEVQPCLRPGCSGTCTWAGRGRPKLFCTAACRTAYDTRRAELVLQIELLETLLHRLPSEPARLVAGDLAKRRWELARYPALGRTRPEGP